MERTIPNLGLLVVFVAFSDWEGRGSSTDILTVGFRRVMFAPPFSVPFAAERSGKVISIKTSGAGRGDDCSHMDS